MNVKSLSTVALATATLALAAPTFIQSANSSAGDRVSFSCQNIFEPASETKIPATVAWVPQRSKNVPIVYWKSDYFKESGWDGQARCQDVSPKFQNFYDSDRLNYLTNGKAGNYPVICAAVEIDGETCNQDNLLFTLKDEAKGDETLQKLMNIVEGSSSVPIYEFSPIEGQIYVPIDEFLLTAPAIEEQNASN